MKDFKHKGTILKVWERQWADIKEREKRLCQEGKSDFCTQYCKGLPFVPDYLAQLTDEQAHMEKLLSQDIPCQLTRYHTDREYFFNRLYYAHPDRATLYLIYSRLLVWEDIAQPPFAEPSPGAPPALFCQRLRQLLDALAAQCPKRMEVPDPDAPGRMMSAPITIDVNTLHTLVHCIKTDWQDELTDYLATRKHPKQAPFSPSLPYLLLGWLARHSTLFGHLPKKQMALLLCRQEGCPYKPTTMETYLTKSIDDGLLTDEYPLMRSLLAFLKKHGKAL